MRRIFSFLSGALLGGFVGASLALLFAPISGDELRLQVQSQAARIQGEVKKAAAERRKELEEQLASLRAPQ